jgi:hypothetical protein
MSHEREVYICRAMRSLGRKGRFMGLDKESNGIGIYILDESSGQDDDSCGGEV